MQVSTRKCLDQVMQYQWFRIKKWSHIMKIFKSFVESALLIRGISKTIRNEAKKQKRGVLGMLLDTLGTSL